MSFPIRWCAVRRLLGAISLMLLAAPVLAAGNWENGNTQYHSICTHCHNTDVTQAAGGGSYPAPSPLGASASYLQGRFNAGAAVGTQMGATYTNVLRTANNGATSPINDTVSDIAAYIGRPNYPVASFSPTTYTFSAIGVGLSPSPTKSFRLSNTGTDTLTVTSVAVDDSTNYSWTSCGNIAAGSYCDIVVTFKPQSVGTFNATLTVLHDDVRGFSSVTLSGQGLAPLAVSPLLLTFTPGTAPTGVLQTTITDRLGNALKICRTDAATFSFPADYTLDAPYTLGGDGCFTTAATGTLPRVIDLNVRFVAGGTGPRNANLVVQRADGAGSSFTVQLQGNPGPLAMVNASSLFDSPPDPAVEVDNDNVLNRSVTLYSKGSQPLVFTGSSFTITGANQAEYTLTGGGCQSLSGLPKFDLVDASSVPPSCVLNLRFNPSDVGLRAPAALLIQIAGTSDNSVALNGFGFRGPRLAVRQAAIALNTGDQLEFGTQTVGGLYAPKTVTLRNGGTLGDLEVVLPTAGSVAGFTFVAGAGCANLAPAAECTVDIRFDPAAVQAYLSAFAIQTRAAGSAVAYDTFTLNLHGQGSASAVPVLSWTDTSGTTISQVVFPDTDAGAPLTRTIRLYNAGPGGVTLQFANVVGLDALNFALNATDCSSGKQLYEGMSCVIDVKFAPGTAGVKTVSIQLSATGSTPPTLIVPPLLVASGTGIATATTASLLVSSTALGFANTRVGAAGLPQELTLSNTGSQTLRVLAMSATAPFGVQAKSCASVPFDLAPGAGCTVSVLFNPQAEGAQSGTLSVTTDGTPAIQSVALSATAEPAANVSSGGGCSVASGDTLRDPVLWAMVGLAIAVLGVRRRTLKGRNA
jgi:cytochrome c553